MKHLLINTRVWTILLCGLITSFSSCRKKPDPTTGNQSPSAEYGVIGFEFSNYVDDIAIKLNVDTVVTGIGEKIVLTKFNYYITNIRFTKADGTEYAEPESYHLVSEETASSKHFHLKNVPVGEYVSITFMIGVDSIRNISGAQEGALDPSMGMFWTWNTGYIMAKVEGLSPQANAPDYMVMHHIGGYSGEFQAQREITLAFPQPMALTQDAEGTVRMRADVLKWFSGTNSISIGTVPIIMSANANSKKIADNYIDMFSVTSITVF